MKLNKQNKKGFTIVELVIVIAVIGILSAILIPTFANLTTQAQEAAAKQQVADAYTAYLVEATDNQYDGFFTRAGSEPNYTYNPVAIAQKSQAQVALKLGTQWYTYDAEKGWGKDDDQGELNLVVNSNEAFYTKTGDVYSASTKTKTDLSTFNGVLVYVL